MPMAKRTRVGYPLTPQILIELGEIQQVGAVRTTAKTRAWNKFYRIYTNHGYRKSGNANDGYLKLTRRVAGSEGGNGWILDVEQKIIQREANVSLIKATINYQYHNRTFALGKWKSSSKFYTPQGTLIADLSSDESTESYGDIDSGKPLIPDWCMFDQVLHLPRVADFASEFNMLEGLSIHKPHQTIKYRGEEVISLEAGSRQRLHRFTQTGPGVLPYDYWIDENGDLGLVVTLSRAYILDSNALNIVADHEKYELDKYKSRKKDFEKRFGKRPKEVVK